MCCHGPGWTLHQFKFLWIWREEGSLIGVDGYRIPRSCPFLLCARDRISHKILCILMTLVQMNITCHQIPQLHAFISTQRTTAVGKIIPRAVREAAGSVESCQEEQKMKKIFFREVHHSDYVSGDILRRHTWDRWLLRRGDYMLWRTRSVPIVDRQKCH